MHLFFQRHLKIFYAVINYIMFHRLCACWIIILNILTQHFVLHVGPKWRRRQRPRNPEDLQEAEGEGAGQWCARETCQAKNREGATDALTATSSWKATCRVPSTMQSEHPKAASRMATLSGWSTPRMPTTWWGFFEALGKCAPSQLELMLFWF